MPTPAGRVSGDEGMRSREAEQAEGLKGDAEGAECLIQILPRL